MPRWVQLRDQVQKISYESQLEPKLLHKGLQATVVMWLAYLDIRTELGSGEIVTSAAEIQKLCAVLYELMKDGDEMIIGDLRQHLIEHLVQLAVCCNANTHLTLKIVE